MTREKARIELCVAQADVWYRPSDDAIDMAIEALEQEPVLDKIRAEIEQIELLASYTRGDIKQKALDIIDKYKESEG